MDYRLLFNSNFQLIRRKTLPTNDFELTVPDLYRNNSYITKKLNERYNVLKMIICNKLTLNETAVMCHSFGERLPPQYQAARFWESKVKMAARAVRFGQSIKELRIHLCQKSPSSQGVRYENNLFTHD